MEQMWTSNTKRSVFVTFQNDCCDLLLLRLVYNHKSNLINQTFSLATAQLLVSFSVVASSGAGWTRKLSATSPGSAELPCTRSRALLPSIRTFGAAHRPPWKARSAETFRASSPGERRPSRVFARPWKAATTWCSGRCPAWGAATLPRPPPWAA